LTDGLDALDDLRLFRYRFVFTLLYVFFVRFLLVVVVVMTVAVRGLAARQQRTRIGAIEAALEFDSNLFVDRAGMRLLLLHTQFGKHVDDDAGFDLKLPSQLVDSDFLHRRDCAKTP
jgi:hypothetical protein